MNKTTLFSLLAGIYLISAGASYLYFSKGAAAAITPVTSTQVTSARSKIDPSLPKTEECPLNGQKYTTVERSIWEGRRPLTVMIENSTDARPQSGMSKADIIYEAVAEGGITRFLNVFYCGAAADEVKMSPVRSARIYFVNWASEYGRYPLFVHYGGANNFCPSCYGGVKAPGSVAKEVDVYAAMAKAGWTNGRMGNDMDGQSNLGVPVLTRNVNRLGDTAVAWEHSVIGSLDEAYKEAAKRGFGATDKDGSAWSKTFTAWKFIDDKPSDQKPATEISFEFWSNKPDFDVLWKYDTQTNSYLRSEGGKPHTDLEFDKPQLRAKNVVIQFVKEKGPLDRELHMYYEVVGTGKAIVFQNGTQINGTWKKTSQFERTKYFDEKGAEIAFVRGGIFIEGVPSANTINVK